MSTYVLQVLSFFIYLHLSVCAFVVYLRKSILLFVHLFQRVCLPIRVYRTSAYHQFTYHTDYVDKTDGTRYPPGLIHRDHWSSFLPQRNDIVIDAFVSTDLSPWWLDRRLLTEQITLSKGRTSQLKATKPYTTLQMSSNSYQFYFRAILCCLYLLSIITI